MEFWAGSVGFVGSLLLGTAWAVSSATEILAVLIGCSSVGIEAAGIEEAGIEAAGSTSRTVWKVPRSSLDFDTEAVIDVSSG